MSVIRFVYYFGFPASLAPSLSVGNGASVGVQGDPTSVLGSPRGYLGVAYFSPSGWTASSLGLPRAAGLFEGSGQVVGMMEAPDNVATSISNLIHRQHGLLWGKVKSAGGASTEIVSYSSLEIGLYANPRQEPIVAVTDPRAAIFGSYHQPFELSGHFQLEGRLPRNLAGALYARGYIRWLATPPGTVRSLLAHH